MQFVSETYIALRFYDGIKSREITGLISEIQEISNYFKIKVSENEILDNITFTYLPVPLSSDKKLNEFFTGERHVFLLKFEGNTKAYYGMYTLIRYHIEKRIQDLVIALTIAKNGAIDCAGALLYFDKKLILEMPILIHGIELALKRSKRLKWPNLRKLPIKTAWCWYESFHEETDGISKTKIGRALNAYSHFFYTTGGVDEQAVIFWALLGIEAIYAEGKENTLQQVNDHTELFLGKRKEFKKSIKELYDYRSRFIHGDLDFSNQFVFKNATAEFIEGLEKLYDNEGFAISILLATFQKLIRTGKKDIQFKKLTKTIIK